MKSVVIGAEEHERVELTVLGYERQATGEFYDDNWLSCEVRVQAGAFGGKYSASFLASELSQLHQSLECLYRNLKGSVRFESMESQLELQFTCDSLGHIAVLGTAMDQAGIGNKLSFSVSFDQTFLQRLVQELRQVVQAYPVRT